MFRLEKNLTLFLCKFKELSVTNRKEKATLSINFPLNLKKLSSIILFAAISLTLASDNNTATSFVLPKITESKRGPSWQESWSQKIFQEIITEKDHPLITTTIHSDDLKTFSCSNFNELAAEQKAAFWIVFFSALTKAESSFNPKARSKAPKGGHGNYGLLQLSKRTARDFCQLDETEENGFYSAENNLICGIKLLSYQIQGAPNKKGKLVRAKAKGRIFTSPIFFWGPLRAKDFKGKKRLMTWFNQQKDQLPFCS